MSRRPYVVNGKTFKTKAKLRDYIRKIRDRYLEKQRLGEGDFAFMLDLLQRHEKPDIKIGCGVSHMYVKTNSVFRRNREFWLVRVDGSETDFSFESCLTHKTKLQKFKEACRTAISSTIQSFKKDFFDCADVSLFCPITGELMTLSGNSHVDHAPPNTFDKIIRDFIRIKDIDVNRVGLLEEEDGRVRYEIEDKCLERDFIDFHNTRADLRVISKLANLSVVKQAKKEKPFND